MPKPTTKKDNHGQAVSAFVHEAQAARGDGHPGIGHEVSAFARDKDGGGAPDFQDGVITVVKADGTTETFTTFAKALEFAGNGDTLQVGAGTYAEAFNLNESVAIVAEEGAVLDGSNVLTSVGVVSTIQLYEGFSGGSISGLTVVAVAGGNALVSIIGEAVEGVTLSGNTFDAGANTLGSLVYFNPGATGVTLEGNTFLGAALTASPLLGIEGDNVQVTDNSFGTVGGTYPKVEVFDGNDGGTEDVALIGNSGLAPEDIVYA